MSGSAGGDSGFHGSASSNDKTDNKAYQIDYKIQIICMANLHEWTEKLFLGVMCLVGCWLGFGVGVGLQCLTESNGFVNMAYMDMSLCHERNILPALYLII